MRRDANSPPPHVGGYSASPLEVKTVNQFGVEGPVSTAEVEIVADAEGRTPRFIAYCGVVLGIRCVNLLGMPECGLLANERLERCAA